MPRSASRGEKRTRMKRKIRRERRRDEESLYYIIERDLDREALFPGNDGWFPQAKVGQRWIDFVIKYGDKILGVEVKKGFPSLDDFRQVSEYSTYLDAIFLAYPSDAAAEAIFLSDTKRTYLNVGLISIALFRSHCIRPAIFSERSSNQTWDEYFNEQLYWSNLEYDFTVDALPATVLTDGCLWSSYDRDGKYSKDCVELKFTKKDWNSLAMLHALVGSTSVYKFHEGRKILRLMKEKMGRSSYSFTNLLKAGIVEDWSYGSSLWLCCLTDSANSYNENMKKVLSKKLGRDDWERIQNLTEVLATEHSAEQKRRLNEFLVV